MSKHRDRKDRRKEYHRMLSAELNTSDRSFRSRVIRVLDRDGLDTAPDGRPIKADLWRFRDSQRHDHATCLAVGELINRATDSCRVSNRAGRY